MSAREIGPVLDFLGITRWREQRQGGERQDEWSPPTLPAAPPSKQSVSLPPGSVPDGVIAGLDWDPLAERVSGCERCPLCRTRTQTVFGSGSRHADWLFVGEAPGAEEDRQGLPFVGRAGQLLTSMIEAMGLERNGVFISNVLKCRPPGNRDPAPDEIKACLPYLDRQISLLKPKIVVVLGRIAAQSLLATEVPISRLRGQVRSYGPDGIPLVVTYHPAYLLRNPIAKRESWRDLRLALATFGGRA
ncbi:MAG: uracil-DNA glycosylase [Gammaproteobacteria bacterium]